MTNEKGYTLLEMLIVLLILLTISSTLPLVFMLLEKWIKQPDGLHSFEWEIASTQIGMDIREGSEVTINQGRLQIMQPPNVISYEQYQNILRRQVNGKGHEVILQNLESVLFRYTENGLVIEVRDLDGTDYKANLYRWLDVMNSE